ncbi:MAG: oxidoreductase [Cryomorphaceae bacterium]|nr:oxidoreductase [Cryomorphaceae bacterium]
MERYWSRFESRWQNYNLIDAGDGEKLERFGSVVVRRPEVTAIWPKSLSENDWRKESHATFVYRDSKSGIWQTAKDFKPNWQITYPLNGQKLAFNLKLTAFKHVGVFPEQAANWEFIASQVQNKPKSKILNLFAYTGGASLAACASGADVTHVDSIRPIVNWASENMESSKLKNIRWTVEDALTFVKREAKRGNLYDGIIMDPPSYGNGGGKNPTKWKLEDQLNELLSEASKILSPQGFLVLNTYSGLSNSTLETLITIWFRFENVAVGDLVLHSDTKHVLSTGSCLRGWNQ